MGNAQMPAAMKLMQANFNPSTFCMDLGIQVYNCDNLMWDMLKHPHMQKEMN